MMPKFVVLYCDSYLTTILVPVYKYCDLSYSILKTKENSFQRTQYRWATLPSSLC